MYKAVIDDLAYKLTDVETETTTMMGCCFIQSIVMETLENELNKRGFHVSIGVPGTLYIYDMCTDDGRVSYLGIICVNDDNCVCVSNNYICELEFANPDFEQQIIETVERWRKEP